MQQDKVFEESEGDAYFRRNLPGILNVAQDMSLDVPLRLMEMYNLRPEMVLEVGAANGFRLEEIRRRYGCDCVGVDASADAVEDGQSRHPKITMGQGLASEIPWDDPFDLVIVNYVLHWVDRSNLLATAAEIDRMVKDGGYLIVGDFAPANKLRVPYHHREPLYTWKQDYGGLFVASGIYHAVAFLSGPHGPGHLSADVPESERAGCHLLRKDLTGHYVGS